MLATIKRILKLERIPPIVFPFIIPLFLVYYAFRVIGFVLMWTFGFWSCNKCKRLYWAKEERQYIGDNEHDFELYECSACKVMEVLTS